MSLINIDIVLTTLFVLVFVYLIYIINKEFKEI
jgi:hypothetical protein